MTCWHATSLSGVPKFHGRFLLKYGAVSHGSPLSYSFVDEFHWLDFGNTKQTKKDQFPHICLYNFLGQSLFLTLDTDDTDMIGAWLGYFLFALLLNHKPAFPVDFRCNQCSGKRLIHQPCMFDAWYRLKSPLLTQLAQLFTSNNSSITTIITVITITLLWFLRCCFLSPLLFGVHPKAHGCFLKGTPNGPWAGYTKILKGWMI